MNKLIGEKQMTIGRKILEILQDERPIRRLMAGFIGRSGLARLFRIRFQVQDYEIFFNPTGLSSLYW